MPAFFCRSLIVLLLYVVCSNSVPVPWTQVRYPHSAQGWQGAANAVEPNARNNIGAYDNEMNWGYLTTEPFIASDFRFNIADGSIVGFGVIPIVRDALNSYSLAYDSVRLNGSRSWELSTSAPSSDYWLGIFTERTALQVDSGSANWPNPTRAHVNSPDLKTIITVSWTGHGSPGSEMFPSGLAEIDTVRLEVTVALDIWLDSVSPNFQQGLDKHSELTISGGNFIDARERDFTENSTYSCVFNSVVQVPAIRISDTELKCVVPQLSKAGVQYITVRARDYKPLSGPVSMFIADIETTVGDIVVNTTILSIAPSFQVGFNSTVITITGGTFIQLNTLACRFGSHVVLATFINSTTIQCLSPGNVTVTTSVNLSISLDGVTWTQSVWTYTFYGLRTVYKVDKPPSSINISVPSDEYTVDWQHALVGNLAEADSYTIRTSHSGGSTQYSKLLTCTNFFDFSLNPWDEVKSVAVNISYASLTFAVAFYQAYLNTGRGAVANFTTIFPLQKTVAGWAFTSDLLGLNLTGPQELGPDLSWSFSMTLHSFIEFSLDSIHMSIDAVISTDIFSITPPSIHEGSPETILEVTGGTFIKPGPTETVTCNFGAQNTLGLWRSSTRLLCPIPLLGNGSYPFSVTLPQGNTSNPVYFIVDARGAPTGTTGASIGDNINDDNSSSSNSSVAIIAGAAGGGGLLLVILVLILVFLKKRKNNQKSSKNDNQIELHSIEGLGTEAASSSIPKDGYAPIAAPTGAAVSARYTIMVPKVFEHERFIVDYSELTIQQTIGEGAFGVVYRGVWRSSPVAVKVLKGFSPLGDKQAEEFWAEVELMKRIRPHQNVVTFLGMCIDPLCIITAFYPEGSLNTLLKSSKEMTLQTKLNIMQGIAAGMLHLSKESIIHKDLAARNVLLSKNLEPAVSDFGMSRLVNADDIHHSKTNIGPVKWMPPESLSQRLFSTKSDVWSFGVTCIEILSRADPYPNVEGMQYAMRVIAKDIQPHTSIPSDTPVELRNLLENCLQYQPENRPGFHEICTMLNDMNVK